MYRVVIDPEAIKFLNKLPIHVRRRIFSKIISAKNNPFHYFERLQSRIDYKLRVGDYRVFADMNRSAQQIHITVIGHRKSIYKKQ